MKTDTKSGKFYLIPIALFLIAVTIAHSSQWKKTEMERIKFFRPVIDTLLANGADTSFVYFIIFHENTHFDEKYAKIKVSNTITSTKKTTVTGPYYSKKYAHNYDALSIKKSKAFLKENLKILKKAEKEYGVSKEAITSVLWVETRHGGYLGDNHVISVYISLAMADQPEFIEKNTRAQKESFTGKEKDWPKIEEKLIARSKKKANWAREQLLAIEKMQEKSPIPVTDIKGSWAGAFGMAQFIPSSYMSWAVDGNGDGLVNLFEKEDAIFSVANYLKTNGWGKTEKSHQKAVFHYNNSNAYVYAVLKLAEKLEK